MIEDYVKEILKEKGLPGDIDKAVYDQMVKDLKERATNLINRRLVEAMPDEKVKELDKVIDNNQDNPEVIRSFIESNVTEKEKVVAAALLEFRSLYIKPSM